MLFSGSTPGELLARLAALVFALSIHEWAHAYSAYRLGDPTAARLGRLTLDPRKHLDPMGALMLLVAGFGWAKPVPINPERLGRWGVLWVSLAGPASNVAQAVATAVVLKLLLISGAVGGSLRGAEESFLGSFLFTYLIINLALAVFNMLPIAPLDGSKVFMSLVDLPYAQRRPYEQYGPMVLLLLIFGGQIFNLDILGAVIGPPIRGLLNLVLALAGLS